MIEIETVTENLVVVPKNPVIVKEKDHIEGRDQEVDPEGTDLDQEVLVIDRIRKRSLPDDMKIANELIVVKNVIFISSTFLLNSYLVW